MYLLVCFSMRQDVFDVIVAFEKKGTEGLTPEEKRYVERMIKYGRRNGMNIAPDKMGYPIIFFLIFP